MRVSVSRRFLWRIRPLLRPAGLAAIGLLVAAPAPGSFPGPGQSPAAVSQRPGAPPVSAEPPVGQRLATPSSVLAAPVADPARGRPGTRPELWTAALAGVRHADVFPGVDLVYLVDGPRREVALLVDAGVDLAAIRLDFPGLTALALSGGGDLLVTTGPLYSLLRRPRLVPLDAANERTTEGLNAGWRRRGPEQVGVWIAGGDVIPVQVLLHFEADLSEVTLADFGAMAVDFGSSATMIDALVGDDGDGLGDPGETIRYTTTMTNAGDTTAQNVQLDATLDAATALVPGSLNISPLAIDDSYTGVIGNVTFNVGAGNGVLDNDRDPPAADCSTCTITAFDAVSANGGNVVLNADGSFTYDPPIGFTGTDTFTYTVEDDHATTPLTNAATVTLDVADVVWFVDNSAASGGDGRQATPFQTLAEAEAGTGVGAIIRVRRGSSGTTPYAGGITLQNQQQLIGGGVDLVVGTTTVETADGNAVITNAGGHVVTLASDNHVEGVELRPVASAGLYRTGALGTTMIDAATIAINGAASDGIFLDNTTGAFSFDNSTVSTTTAGAGIGVRVDGGSPAVAIGNSAVSKTGGRVLDVLNTTGGTVTFTGGSLTSTNGLGLRVSNADGDVTINASTALSITGATGTPITVTGTSPGATMADVTIAGGTITTNNGAFPLISGTNSSGSLALTNATLTHSGGRIVDFDDMDGGGSFSGTTVTNTDHDGVRIIDSAGTFASFFDVVVVNPPADAIVLQNNTSTVSFGLINVATNGAGIRGIFASNGGTVNVTNSASQIASTGSAAVDIDNTTLGMTFASVSSSNSNVAGIDLDAVGGSFVANGGTVSGATGVGVDINGGSGTITYAGNVTNTTNRAVEITARAGGTLTLSGTINETGTGVRIANNTGGTINLSGSSKVLNTGTNIPLAITSNTNAIVNVTGGGLVIDATSATGLNATGGGTLTVGGAGNTITTATGTALNVANTTIGASGVTFRSISSNGGANGIVLNSTGSSGGLTVTGNGGNCTEADPTCTGGRIQNTAGSDDSSSTPIGTGIVLNNTRAVSLTRMRLDNHSNYAIRGTSVDGFTMTNSLVDGANGTNSATPFNDGSLIFHGVTGSSSGMTGTSSITNSIIRGGYQRNVGIDNSVGTLNLTVSGNTIKASSDAAGDDGFHLEADTVAHVTVVIAGNTFARHGGDHINLSLVNNATVTATITNNTLRGNNVSSPEGNHPIGLGQGIFILGASFNGTFDYDVSDNVINGNRQGGSIHVNKGSGTATYNGRIQGNVIGTAGVTGSGSIEAFGIIVGSRGSGGSHTTLIDSNIVRQYFDRGIVLEAGEGSSALDATVTNNTVTEFADAINSLHGIHSDNGILSGDSNSVCMDIRANLVATAGNEAGGGADIRLRKSAAAGLTVRIPGLVGGTSTDADNHITANNPTATTVTVTNSGGAFTGGAACAQPSLPSPEPTPSAGARQARERLVAPVHGDMREESVLDLVPLAGARREVADGDREPGSVGETLELPFPEAAAGPLLPPASAGEDWRSGRGSG